MDLDATGALMQVFDSWIQTPQVH